LVPFTHEMHPVAPIVSEYVPVAQREHADKPVLAAKSPTAHGVHVELETAAMIEELVPMGHRLHSLKSKAPPYSTYVPIGQFAHSVPLAYLPAKQGGPPLTRDADMKIETTKHKKRSECFMP
jgi:hypothetical protein